MITANCKIIISSYQPLSYAQPDETLNYIFSIQIREIRLDKSFKFIVIYRQAIFFYIDEKVYSFEFILDSYRFSQIETHKENQSEQII